MAQYKVPQDVEAEDKLLGPFTFRQFIYLMVGAACIAATWGALQIFAPFAIIPLPFGIFFIVLALPLKKDQPMETYLAAVISYHFRPNRRFWTAGQRESTILITAPKKQEKSRTRDITEDEASHRLSFLADIVDTEGAAIRGSLNSSFKEEYVAEANQVDDLFEANNAAIDRMIAEEKAEREAEIALKMQRAVQATQGIAQPPQPHPVQPQPISQPQTQPQFIQPQAYQPQPLPQPTPQSFQPSPQQSYPAPNSYQPQSAEIRERLTDLAHNSDYSIQTIAAEANRIQNQAIFTPQEGT